MCYFKCGNNFFFAFFLPSPGLCVFGCFHRFLCTTLLISTMALTPTSVCLEFSPGEGRNYAFSRLINQQNRGKHQKINQKSFHFSMKIVRGVFPTAPAFFSFFALPQLISNRNEFILLQKNCLCKHNVLNHVSKPVVSECAFVLHEKCLFNCC